MAHFKKQIAIAPSAVTKNNMDEHSALMVSHSR